MRHTLEAVIVYSKHNSKNPLDPVVASELTSIRPLKVPLIMLDKLRNLTQWSTLPRQQEILRIAQL